MGHSFSGQNKRSALQGRDTAWSPAPYAVPDWLKKAIIASLSFKTQTPFNKLLTQLNANGRRVMEFELENALSVLEKSHQVVSFRPETGDSEWKRK